MQVPANVLAAPAWSVRGYAERSLHEHGFALDDAVVGQIARSSPRAKLAKRTIEPASATSRSYEFELRHAGATLSALCTERTTPEPHVLGFGARELRLECVCRDGAQPRGQPVAQSRSTLSLLDGEGSARLSDGTGYQVSQVRESAAGKRQAEPLGYLFVNPSGTGALERTGNGRAWPPTALDARVADELRCLYAALLLYRP